jgi:hypothetical protein
MHTPFREHGNSEQTDPLEDAKWMRSRLIDTHKAYPQKRGISMSGTEGDDDVYLAKHSEQHKKLVHIKVEEQK